MQRSVRNNSQETGELLNWKNDPTAEAFNAGNRCCKNCKMSKALLMDNAALKTVFSTLDSFGTHLLDLKMGAAVGVELAKPVDASDITEGDLILARNEIMRLRHALGHLAKAVPGFGSEVVYDASDLVHGDDEKADFDRCVDEVKHIRSALRLSTAGGKRRERAANIPTTLFIFAPDDEDGSASSSDSSSSDKDESAPADAGADDLESGVKSLELDSASSGEGMGTPTTKSDSPEALSALTNVPGNGSIFGHPQSQESKEGGATDGGN